MLHTCRSTCITTHTCTCSNKQTSAPTHPSIACQALHVKEYEQPKRPIHTEGLHPFEWGGFEHGASHTMMGAMCGVRHEVLGMEGSIEGGLACNIVCLWWVWWGANQHELSVLGHTCSPCKVSGTGALPAPIPKALPFSLRCQIGCFLGCSMPLTSTVVAWQRGACHAGWRFHSLQDKG